MGGGGAFGEQNPPNPRTVAMHCAWVVKLQTVELIPWLPPPY